MSTGKYEVVFNRNVTDCAYVATLGNPAASTPPSGEIVVASRIGNSNGVFIATRDSAGTDEDRSFHVAVLC